MRTRLDTTLRLAAAEIADARGLDIEVTVSNPSKRAVRLDAVAFAYAPAVLRARDAVGDAVPMVPPSVPPAGAAAASRLDLEPGAAASFRYAGAALFDEPLAPGRYALQFRLELGQEPSGREWSGVLASPWVEFVVTPDGPGR